VRDMGSSFVDVIRHFVDVRSFPDDRRPASPHSAGDARPGRARHEIARAPAEKLHRAHGRPCQSPHVRSAEGAAVVPFAGERRRHGSRDPQPANGRIPLMRRFFAPLAFAATTFAFAAAATAAPTITPIKPPKRARPSSRRASSKPARRSPASTGPGRAAWPVSRPRSRRNYTGNHVFFPPSCPTTLRDVRHGHPQGPEGEHQRLRLRDRRRARWCCPRTIASA
jgi:hypothetical protein